MNNPTYYAVLTADVRYSPELSAQEKLLFAEITALSNKDGFCSAGNSYFSKLYSLTEPTISRQVKHLEECVASIHVHIVDKLEVLIPC